jgi:hypothetical protein
MTTLTLFTEIPVIAALLLVLGVAAMAWWLAWQETHDAPAPTRWLPLLRSAAVGMVTAMLLEPVVHHRQLLGEPSRLRIWIDGSASMQETDGTDASRYERAVALLLGGDVPRLESWADTSELDVQRGEAGEATPLWSSSPRTSPPPLPTAQQWMPKRFSTETSLTGPLEAALTSRGDAGGKGEQARLDGQTPQEPRAPVLLLTDGRHTLGPSPLDLLATWPAGQMPIWVVGMGSSLPPPRLTIRRVESPTQLFATDRLEGVLELVDHLPPGEPFRVLVALDAQRPSENRARSAVLSEPQATLWSDSLVSDGSGLRRLSFSFPVEAAMEQLSAIHEAPAADDVLRLPLPLKARIVREPRVATDRGSAAADDSAGWLVGITTRRQRVLFLDGRGRWEARYLRNALERDPHWSVDAFLVKPGASPRWFSQGTQLTGFPDSIEAWLTYDLVITGEIEPTAATTTALKILPELVERAGIGWIAIDGERDTWSADTFAPLRAMLPVERLDQADVASKPTGQAWRPFVSTAGSSLGAFQLGEDDRTANASIWEALPGFRSVVPVRLLPGGEAFVEVRRDGETMPLISSRLFGAGRVVHVAGDETWRWRYQLADLVHQRFWNQLARWAMRIPFAVRNDYVSLDAGDVTVPFGQPITVRALLRQPGGSSAETMICRAVASLDGSVVSAVELAADPELPGLVEGQWASLPPGRYTIRLEATGFTPEALDLETVVEVVAPATREQLDLSRNDDLLRRIADASGGLYVAEDRVEDLWERIDLEQTSRLVQSDTLLWQSGWWFGIVMTLLTTEWWLRKRAGLI